MSEGVMHHTALRSARKTAAQSIGEADQSAARPIPSGLLAPTPAGEMERIAFLLLPGFSMAAFSAAVEPLRVANMVAGQDLFSWSVFSRDGADVQPSNGVVLHVTGRIPPAAPFRNIVVCGGLGTAKLTDQRLFGWLRHAARREVSIGALCTGTFVLARAGLLDGYRCTVHWAALQAFRETFPSIQVCHDMYVVDRRRFSCIGGTSACDMMLKHIALRHGEPLASKTAQTLLHQSPREPAALVNCPLILESFVRDAQLRAALCGMETHIEYPLSLEEIAQSAGLSLRSLQRKFRKQLGVSPHAYYLNARLNRAKELLKQTDMSVTQVALACGFGSHSHFSTAFRKASGRSPIEFQRSGQATP